MTKKSIFDRAIILECSFSLIKEKGSQGLTFENLSRLSGISKGSIQYHFKTKEDIVDALIERWISVFNEEYKTLINEEKIQPIQAYAQLTKLSANNGKAREQVLQIEMLKSDRRIMKCSQWYDNIIQSCISPLNDTIKFDVLILFFALEGIHLMKGFGFLQLENYRYIEIIDGIIRRINKEIN
jgi:AcrR family transcriptional regulator